MTIPAADLARLNDCRHHDPHGFYGWHEGTVRTRQPGATAVQLHTPTQSLSMNLVGDDIWEAEDEARREQKRLEKLALEQQKILEQAEQL